jgi:hypothetical protein
VKTGFLTVIRRGGIRPGSRTDAESGHFYANGSGTAEVQAFVSLRSGDEGFFCCIFTGGMEVSIHKTGGTNHEAH